MDGDTEQRVRHLENQVVNLNGIMNKLMERVKNLEGYFKMMGYSKEYEKNLIQISDQEGK